MSVSTVVRRLGSVLAAAGAAVVLAAAAGPPQRSAAAPAPTVVLMDTVKGPMEIELYAADAPKSVAHVLALIQKGFYRGLRFHRVTPALLQFGDPQTRNVTLRNAWGTGNSGDPVGVAELSKTRHFERGSVGLAYPGDSKFAESAKFGDSQLFIMKRAEPGYDGKYALVGKVVKGLPILDQIQESDVIRNITVK